MLEPPIQKDKILMKSYSLGLSNERIWNKGYLSTIFICWSIFSAIDIILNFSSLNGNKISQEEFIFMIALLFLRAIGFLFYYKNHKKAGTRSSQIFELIFAIIFSVTAIFTWNLQINMDINRSIIVGLDIAWVLRFSQLLFGEWAIKSLIDTSAAVFVIIKFSKVETEFGIAYVQASLQIVCLLVLLYSREKVQKSNFKRVFSMERTEETLKNILDNIPENIAVLNLNGDLVYYNRFLDACFGISEHENDEIDIFTRFHSVKPREKYFDLSSLNESKSSFKIPTNKTKCRVLARKMTLKSFTSNNTLYSFNSKGLTSRRSRGLNLSLNINAKKDLKYSRQKSKGLTPLSFRRLGTNTRFSHIQKMASAHLPTKTVRSLEELTSVQEIINFFVANMHLFKNHNTNLNNFYIFDCKYKEDESAAPKSYEIKVSLANFDGDESFILILRDTTHRDIIATLEANDSFKNSVLKSVSHELRTPLNTNLNLLEIAIDDHQTPQTMRDNYLIPAHQTGKLLYSLIKDVLDYSLFLAHKFALHSKTKDIRQTLNKVNYLFESQARRKGIGFRLNISGGISQELYTDHRRLCQILTNLISNAMKFTTQGEISLMLEPYEADNQIVKFTVSDTGCGITESQCENLQKAFDMSDASKNYETTGGIGMGLMMSNMLSRRLSPRISELYGLQFNSKVGEGSTFWFFVDTKSVFLPLISAISMNGNSSVNREGYPGFSSFKGSSRSHAVVDLKEEEPPIYNRQNSSDNKFGETQNKFPRLTTIDKERMTTGIL